MKAVLAFSGGLYSTALLWELRHQGHCVHCLYVDYGQATAGKGLGVAEHLVSRANQRRKPGQEIDLSCVTISGLAASPQPSHGIVRRKDFEFFGLQILSVAAAQAVAMGADTLACGVTAAATVNGFAPAWANMVGLLSREHVGFLAPFVDREADWILARATQRGTPLVETWSCLLGRRNHCGTCRGCKSRRRAFAAAGISDYTLYAGEEPTILPFARPDQPRGAA